MVIEAQHAQDGPGGRDGVAAATAGLSEASYRKPSTAGLREASHRKPSTAGYRKPSTAGLRMANHRKPSTAGLREASYKRIAIAERRSQTRQFIVKWTAREWARNNFPELTSSAPRSGTTAVPTRSVGTRRIAMAGVREPNQTVHCEMPPAREWVKNNFPELTSSAPRSGRTAVPTRSVGTRVSRLVSNRDVNPGFFQRRPSCRGEELRRKAANFSRSFPLFPPGRSGHREQITFWRTGLYGDGPAVWRPRGEKSQKAKVRRRRSSPQLFRMPASLVGSGEQVIR